MKFQKMKIINNDLKVDCKFLLITNLHEEFTHYKMEKEKNQILKTQLYK
jgi:hypothetical protein